MNLSELVGKGAFIDSGITGKSVSWTNDEGSSVEFEISIKNEISAADYEFIYLGFGAEDDADSERSLMARRVHKLTRIGDGKETIPVEDAKRMKHSLLMAICKRINEVHADSKKKPKPRPKKSGTS